MLMTAVHMDSSSSTTSPPPPWLPVLAVPAHHHQLLHDFTFTPPGSAAAASSPATPAPPSSTNQHHLLLRRVATKRRPRPSRRQPPTATTTYISADPASFRRMVHQVTGADDLPHSADVTEPETLARPAPVRADGAGGGGFAFTCPGDGGAPLLPTLDTSAFLVDARSSSSSSPSRITKGRTDCYDDGSASAAALPLEVEARRACNDNAGGGGGFFPTLESWDHHHALF